MFINNVCLFFTIVIGASALPQNNLKIINGDEVDPPHSLPYQVLVKIPRDNGNTICGASLISAQYVLTAAQCLTDGNLQDTLVVLGAHNVSYQEPSQLRLPAAACFIHPNYDIANLVYNVAIIKLVDPIEFNENIQPVTLPSREDNNTYAGSIGKVAGWGAVDTNNPVASPVLNYIENPILSNEECENMFNFLDSTGMCLSGDGGKSFCFGDTGSPLTVNGVQVGVASYFAYFCNEETPQVFTRVTKILDWILSTIEQ